MLIASLVYLYVLFTWYSSGTIGAWLGAAAFLTPFVAAVALIGAISLFFMSIGTLAGKMDDKMMMNVLWKFVMLEGITSFIVTAAGSWFYPIVAAFVLSYIGAMVAGM